MSWWSWPWAFSITVVICVTILFRQAMLMNSFEKYQSIVNLMGKK